MISYMNIMLLFRVLHYVHAIRNCEQINEWLVYIDIDIDIVSTQHISACSLNVIRDVRILTAPGSST